jgi:hypothetical protein
MILREMTVGTIKPYHQNLFLKLKKLHMVQSHNNSATDFALNDTAEKEDINRLNLEEDYVGNDRGLTAVVDDDDLEDDDDTIDDDDDLDLDVDEIDVDETDLDEGADEVVPTDADIDDDLALDEDDDDEEDDEF